MGSFSLPQDYTRPFQGLGNAFEAQQQQAQQAQILNDEQLKRYLDVTNPDDSIRLAQAAAQARGNYPDITTNIAAANPTEGVMKGIAVAIGNAQKIRGYNHQLSAQNDIAQQYQTAQAQRKQFLDQQIAGQHQQAGVIGQKLGGRTGELYPYLNSAGQQAALGDIVQNENDVNYAPVKALAIEEGNRGVRAAQMAEYGPKPMEVGGVPQPARVNQYERVFGRKPVTTVDIEHDLQRIETHRLQNQENRNNLSVQPQRLQQQLQKDDQQLQQGEYETQIKKIQSQFEEQEKRLSIARDQFSNAKSSLEYKKGLDDYKRLQKGRMLFDQLQQSGDLQSSDPQKQAEIQAVLGMNGITYNPAKVNYKTIKDKQGQIFQFDPSGGKVRKILNKGDKVSFGPWEGVSP